MSFTTSFIASPIHLRPPSAHSHISAVRPRRNHAARSSQPITSCFSIQKTVLPADSDYSAALWHGTYIRWLEEARVLYLADCGLDYHHLVTDLHTELVVRDLSIRYSSPARLGDHVRVSVRVGDRTRVRLEMLSSIQCVADGRVCATATVTLAPIDTATGKVRRAWPPALINALANAQPAA